MSGIGKRFIDSNYKEPKPLIIVEDKPIIEHIIRLFQNENNNDCENDFVFIINNIHEETTNIKYILSALVPNCKIYTVDVKNNAGPVQAVIQIAEQEINDMDEDIIISYCDYSMKWDYNNFINHIKDNKPDGCILYYTGFHPHMLHNDNYAFIKHGDCENFEEIQEKKAYTDNKMSEYTSNGTYYFKNGFILKKYFQRLINENNRINNEFYVSMVYNLMKKDNLYVTLFPIQKMLQWGVPRDLEEYLVWSTYFNKRDIDFIKSYSNDDLNDDLNELNISYSKMTRRNSIKSYTEKNNSTLIIPMAGAGSRFTMANYNVPKPLLPIEGKPMFIKAILDLPPSSNIILVCQSSHCKEYDIENIVKTYIPNKCNIHKINYITNGQATTCEIALQNYDIPLNKSLIISACDNGIYYKMEEYIKLVNNPKIDVIVFSFSNNSTSKLYPHMYAWLDVDENNMIKRVSIKKPFDDIENKYAIVGTMFFKKGQYFMEGLRHIYDNNLKTNNEYYVDNLIEPLVNMGYKCSIFNVDNYLCWGTPNDYQTYNYWFEYFCVK